MKRKKNAAILFFLVSSTIVNAQMFNEYFVTVNPDNGTFSNVNMVPHVAWILTLPPCSAVDKINNRYFFVGKDTIGNNRLYTLDEHTGNVLYNPYFPPVGDTSDQPAELQFDDSALTLYGVCWNATTQTENFISVNQITGAITVISSIDSVRYIADGAYTYDQNDHIYFFRGTSGTGTDILYSIQSTTGNILNHPVIDTGVGPLIIRYDNASNLLYGNEAGEIFEIDPATANATVIANITGIISSVIAPNYTTFDEIHNRYIFGASDTSGLRLYSVDVTSGDVVSNPPFPVGLDSGENVIELNYDNGDSTLYGLHWGYINKVTGINTVTANSNIISYYPNPASNSITFSLSQTYHNAVINIYDVLGQRVMNVEQTDVSQAIINRGNLQNGPYFFEVIADGRRLDRERLLFNRYTLHFSVVKLLVSVQ